MQIIHDPAKLNSQTDKLSRLQTARSLNSGIQRLTAQIFLDEIIIIFVNFQIVDDRDSRMAQPLQKRCFLNETALCPPDTLNRSLFIKAPDAWLKKTVPLRPRPITRSSWYFPNRTAASVPRLLSVYTTSQDSLYTIPSVPATVFRKILCFFFIFKLPSDYII